MSITRRGFLRTSAGGAFAAAATSTSEAQPRDRTTELRHHLDQLKALYEEALGGPCYVILCSAQPNIRTGILSVADTFHDPHGVAGPRLHHGMPLKGSAA
ncbi:twin-arginine translocation signal domain-containing protein [Aminobacter aganoensis]|uniref:Twin-arginine translocation signal domain-containing protein n=1 Tax=Aminobacter aganoensis TaxID=83264 RepID=A0A7X0FC14_9HYPH|nr:twin-arginine translocation signal domain-containing protein [Aminobacter aganoensis]MBB6356934.1 hypothetical protein [Aminobacter aganoensis]